MSTSDCHVSVWAIIPAAGLSKRMGRPKQTLSFGDSTIIGTVVRSVLSGGVDGVVVVTRQELMSTMNLPDDPRVKVAWNEEANSDMFHSIQIGVRCLGSFGIQSNLEQTEHERRGILVVPGDMPAITPTTIRACAEAFRNAPDKIVIACYRGRRGHPIVLDASLLNLREDLPSGLKTLRDRYTDRVRDLAVDDPGVLNDIDTVEDLR